MWQNRGGSALWFVTMFVLSGCGGSEVPEPAPAPALVMAQPAAEQASPARPTTEREAAPKEGEGESPAESEVARFVNIFEPPSAAPPPPEPKPEPEPEPAAVSAIETAPAVLPNLRLLGFTSVGSDRALLIVNEQLVLVAVGDRVQDLEVVSVGMPELKLRWSGQQDIVLNLIEQRPPQDAVGPPTSSVSGTVTPPRGPIRRPPPTRSLTGENDAVPPTAGALPTLPTPPGPDGKPLVGPPRLPAAGNQLALPGLSLPATGPH